MERALPNWILAYEEYTADTDSPRSFHLWTALFTIAGAAQRKIYIPFSHYNIHSSFYLMFVSPPGKSKKTSAMNIGKHILSEVPGIHFAADETSVSALVEQFSKIPNKLHQSLSAFSGELGTLITPGDSHIVNFLTAIYDDNPAWHKQTRMHGPEKITKPWLNLFGCTTPKWLSENMGVIAMEGGLMSRMLTIYENVRLLNEPWPEPTDEGTIMREKLIHDLMHIAELGGEFRATPEAKAFYVEWYKDEKRFPILDDPRVSGYYERKHVHVLKVAMALSLAESDSLVLEQRDIEAAINILGENEPGMHRAVSAVGKNTQATVTERVMAQIIAAGDEGIKLAELLKANINDVDHDRLASIIGDLRAMGDITIKGDRYVAQFTAA